MIVIKATLRAGVNALHLMPYTKKGTEPAAVAHSLLWSLMGWEQDAAKDRKPQDYVWRDEGNGTYIIIASREPRRDHEVLAVETKPFPMLRSGDYLRFILRANAVKNGPVTTQGLGERGTRFGIIEYALRAGAADEGGDADPQAVATRAVGNWIARQGEASGFRLDEVHLTLHDWKRVALHRKRGKRPLVFEQFDASGMLVVGDNPDLFRAALLAGFGRAKGFGCGLMKVGRR